MHNPNFPGNLDIRPSKAPVVQTAPGVSALGKEDQAVGENVDGRFDHAAQEDAIRAYGIAGRVWEASYAILAYLDRNQLDGLAFDPPPFTHGDPSQPTVVIELGSGTGLVAARIAEQLHDREDIFVATDLPEVCPLLENNLGMYSNVRVRPLAWGDRTHAATIASDLNLSDTRCFATQRCLSHIICSDLVYFPALLAPLLRTLLHITSPPFVVGAPSQIIISYKIRSLVKETPFWSAFGLWFSFAPVFVQRGGGPWTRFAPVAEDDETFVFVAHRKPESWKWSVPEDDRDLLAGVGAYGNDGGKSDDTFESILFMGMTIIDE